MAFFRKKLNQIANSILSDFTVLGSYGDELTAKPHGAEKDMSDKKEQQIAIKPAKITEAKTKSKTKTEIWKARRSDDLICASRFSSQFPLPLMQPRKNKGQDYVRTINDWVYRLISSSDYGPPTVVDWLYLAILEDKARKTKSRTVSIDSIWEVVSLISDDGGSGYKRFVKGLLRWFHCKFVVGPNGDPGAMIAWDFFEAINIKGFTKKWEPAKGNIAVFTEKHFRRILDEEVPYDLEVLRQLTHSPGALAMYLFVSQRAYKAAENKEGIVYLSTNQILNQLGSETYGRERDARKRLKKWKTECDEALTATGMGVLPLNIPEKKGSISIFPKHLVPGTTSLPQNTPTLKLPKKQSKPKATPFDLDWVLEKELAAWENGETNSLTPAAARYRAEKSAALGAN